MKIAVMLLVIALAGVSALGQSPTLRVVTDDPNLPSQLFYGNVQVKPLRVRPGTNPPQFITIDDTDFFVQQQYVDFLNRMADASGFAFWNSNITNCGANAACVDVARVNTSVRSAVRPCLGNSQGSACSRDRERRSLRGRNAYGSRRRHRQPSLFHRAAALGARAAAA